MQRKCRADNERTVNLQVRKRKQENNGINAFCIRNQRRKGNKIAKKATEGGEWMLKKRGIPLMICKLIEFYKLNIQNGPNPDLKFFYWQSKFLTTEF